MCQTLAGLLKHSDHTVTVHTSFVPQPLNFLFCAPLVLESVNVLENRTTVPHHAQGALLHVSVFPSFTYLTAACCLPFYILFSSALAPAEQWIILIVGLSDPLISMSCVDFDRFDCDEAVPLWLEVSR